MNLNNKIISEILLKYNDDKIFNFTFSPDSISKKFFNHLKINNFYNFFFYEYENYNHFSYALINSGLKSLNLIIGLDFSKTNFKNGGGSYYYHNNLLQLDNNDSNLYLKISKMFYYSLYNSLNDKKIYIYSFGNEFSSNNLIFNFKNNKININDITIEYKKIIKNIKFSYFKCYYPLINKSINIMNEENIYQLLLIITDGQFFDINETFQIIKQTKKYNLYILFIIIGKGSLENIKKLSDKLNLENNINFCFIYYHHLYNICKDNDIEFMKHSIKGILFHYLVCNFRKIIS